MSANDAGALTKSSLGVYLLVSSILSSDGLLMRS